MRKTFATLIPGLLAASLMVAAQTNAKPPGKPAGTAPTPPDVVFFRHHGPGGMMGKWWKDSETVKQVQLSDAQAQQIEQAFMEHRMRLIDEFAALQKEELKLHNLIDADQLDEGQINLQLDQVVAARGQLEREHAAMLLNARRVLSLEQWKKLQAIRGDHMMGGFGARKFQLPVPPPPPLPPDGDE